VVRPRKAQTPETKLKSQAKDWLAYHRIWTFPVLQGLGAHPGIADRLGFYKGRGIALEFKSPRGKLNENQTAFKALWEKAGGVYITCRSIEDLAAGLGIKTLLT